LNLPGLYLWQSDIRPDDVRSENGSSSLKPRSRYVMWRQIRTWSTATSARPNPAHNRTHLRQPLGRIRPCGLSWGRRRGRCQQWFLPSTGPRRRPLSVRVGWDTCVACLSVPTGWDRNL